MSRSIGVKLLLVSVLTLLAEVGPAAAQFPSYNRTVGNPYQQPTISPYLNLLRAGDPAANYYLLVRPEFQQRALNTQFGSAIVDLERRATADQTPPPTADELLPQLPSTGHSAVFMNYGGYFNAGPTSRTNQRSNQPAAPVSRGRR